VIDTENLESMASHTIRNDEGRAGDHKLPGSGDAAGAADRGMLDKELLDRVHDAHHRALCHGGSVLGDVSVEGGKVVERFRRPDDVQARADRARAERGRAQERTARLTSS
jgi:hypothetical protein